MQTPESLLTQVCEDRDFVQWHRGCPWCAVWVVRVDHAQVHALVQQTRGAIAPWLLPRYARQPHITVAYRGLMAGDVPHPNAAFTAQHLRQDIQTLQAAGLAAASVQLGGAGSFTTVPYIAVQPHPLLDAAHAALYAQAPYPGWQYVPHVTLGHFAQQLPMAQVLQTLQQAPAAGVQWQATVDALWLARYESRDIAGPLTFEGRFDLRTQSYFPALGALLAV